MKKLNEWRDAIAKVGIFLVGLVSFVRGVWLIYKPAGYIAAGLLCVALALLLDKTSSPE